jgi:hypothetical protein
VIASDRTNCGRVKDLYFDDQSWAIKHVVIALDPRQFGPKQVLLTPGQIMALDDEFGSLQLFVPASEVTSLPLASTVLPVCKQYASIALASPGASLSGRALLNPDPHLRSSKIVTSYRIDAGGELGGTLQDLIFDDGPWEIRYLAVEQIIERRKLLFHILPQSVERFTWATQRVLLRDLQPVELVDESSRLEHIAAG